jgi:hypothetical protein
MVVIQAGGCQCGAIRYELSAAPLTLYTCHCTECQKQSTSAFGMSLRVPRGAFRIVKGEPKVWHRTADSGMAVVCHFCGDCGTRLIHDAEFAPGTVNIKPGTLDDTSGLGPVANIWTGSAQPWVHLSDEMLNYKGQPADFGPLLAKWREQAG